MMQIEFQLINKHGGIMMYGTYDECWNYLVKHYAYYTLKDIIDAGVKIISEVKKDV